MNKKKLIIFLIILSGFVLNMLSVQIVGSSLKYLQGELNASIEQISYVMSASLIARNDCCAISISMPISSPLIPPVSITTKRRSNISPQPYFRSLVRPEKLAPKASRLRVRRLNKVDFPTLGLPTKAITGIIKIPTS